MQAAGVSIHRIGRVIMFGIHVRCKLLQMLLHLHLLVRGLRSASNVDLLEESELDAAH